MFDLFGKKPDRIVQNDSDGQIFYGYDHKDGTSDLFNKDGSMDSIIKTPYDEDDD